MEFGNMKIKMPLCSLTSGFIGGTRRNCVSNISFNRIGFLRRPVQCKVSRVGKKPVEVPPNVIITLNGQDLNVKGPLGELSRSYPREVKLERDETGCIKVFKTLDSRRAHQMHGLFRTLTDNMVIGVSKGFEKKLQLVGIGYRAVLEGGDLVMSLGFSHPVRVPIPDGLHLKVEDGTIITVSGYDKCFVGDFAATLRRWRPPEPYKGKGIRYLGEAVRMKEGKAGKKK